MSFLDHRPIFTVRRYRRLDCGCVNVTEVWLAGIRRQQPENICADHLDELFEEAARRRARETT